MTITIQTPAFIQLGKYLQPVGIFDEITLKQINERKIQIQKTSGYKIPTNDCNPIYQVAAALQRLKPNKLGVSIVIKKTIPTFSGLNSQFSNAAGALIALNKLWKFNLKKKELIKIAKIIDPKLVKMLKHFLEPKKNGSENVILARPKHIVIDKNWAEGKSQVNLFRYFPDLKTIVRILQAAGANQAGLSENGSVIFGLFKKSIDKKVIKKELHDKLDFLWVGKTCNSKVKFVKLKT